MMAPGDHQGFAADNQTNYIRLMISVTVDGRKYPRIPSIGPNGAITLSGRIFNPVRLTTDDVLWVGYSSRKALFVTIGNGITTE